VGARLLQRGSSRLSPGYIPPNVRMSTREPSCASNFFSLYYVSSSLSSAFRVGISQVFSLGFIFLFVHRYLPTYYSLRLTPPRAQLHPVHHAATDTVTIRPGRDRTARLRCHAECRDAWLPAIYQYTLPRELGDRLCIGTRPASPSRLAGYFSSSVLLTRSQGGMGDTLELD